MQKLSKGLVKKLIYEARKEAVFVKGDPKGDMTPEELKKFKEDPDVDPDDITTKEGLKLNPGVPVSLTQESLDRIVREEVEAYYGAKK